MLEYRITLFELLGFKVNVDLSWVFLAILVTWSLALGAFPFWHPGYSAVTYWSMGFAGMLGLVFSLVFHELSHSLVARHYGLPIKGITLFIFGGVAEMEEEPKDAKTEFLVAIAGPIASFALAAGFHLIGQAGGGIGAPEPVVGVVEYLAFINLLLGGFNLIPAFPLDGGRVLRAALWHRRGDLRSATRTASNSGKILGVALMVLGGVNVIYGNFVGGMWWFLIGLFVRGAAEASYQQLAAKRIFEGEPVSRFMTHETVAVPPNLSIRRFVEDYVYDYHYDLFPVVEGRRLIGCVHTRQVKAVPRESWGMHRVDEIMSPCTKDNTVGPETDAVAAMALMRRTGASRLIVARDDGALVGIVALKDMLELFALKMDLEGPA